MFKFKAHQYFWITCLFFVLLWFLWIKTDDVFDINIHDTYYVIANVLVAKLLFVFYGFVGFIYWTFYKVKISLIRMLTKLHILITIGCVPIYFLVVNLIFEFKPESDFPLFGNSNYHVYFLLTLYSLVIIAQLIFVINLLISSIKYFKRKS